MPVRRADWRRIRVDVGELKRLTGGTVAFNLFLAFASSGVTAWVAGVTLPAETSATRPFLSRDFFWTAAALGLLAGLSLVFHFVLKSKHGHDVDRVCADMDRIEADMD